MNKTESSQPKKSDRYKRFTFALLQLTLLLAVFLAATRYQEQDMLHIDAQQSPVFKLIDLQGQSHQIGASEQGKKKQLLYFFAPWCTICHLSISNIEMQKDALREKNFEVFYIGLDWKEPRELTEFTKEHELSFPVLMGNHLVSQKYAIQGFPTYYVLNEQGAIVQGSVGYSSALGIWLRSLKP